MKNIRKVWEEKRGKGFWENVSKENRISKERLLLSLGKLRNQVLEVEQSLFELDLFRYNHCMLCCPIFASFCSIYC